MLGFATVDVSKRAGTLTVWLTSQVAASAAGHTNAVTFALDDTLDPVQAEGMLTDRYVVVTDRTDPGQRVLAGWDVRPCDMSSLGSEVTARQEAVLSALARSTQPTLPVLPGPVDQAALDDGRPAMLTLAVADLVQRTWTAWLVTEFERVKRRKQMPEGLDGDLEPLPGRFVEHSTVQPLRARP